MATRVKKTWVKICGITRVEDALLVVDAGADALGLNFADSPRHVGVATAAEIARAVRGRIERVALFVDAPPATVRAVLDAVEIDLLQFHGAESGAYCRQFGLPYVKVIRVRAPLDLATLEAEYGDARALLLDTWVEGVPGGTGQRFDWSLWPRAARLPLVLSGGLTAENVREAVQRLAPYGVDVASGVEGARKGEKDAGKVRRFMAEVQGAGSE
ncbi:MAG: phosphoribosylanthranilate isomerase [Pseudomonadales bacterium]|nr:phosphoribosylanthranilate isomerase [Pseudomonadales bacterium]